MKALLLVPACALLIALVAYADAQGFCASQCEGQNCCPSIFGYSCCPKACCVLEDSEKPNQPGAACCATMGWVCCSCANTKGHARFCAVSAEACVNAWYPPGSCAVVG